MAPPDLQLNRFKNKYSNIELRTYREKDSEFFLEKLSDEKTMQHLEYMSKDWTLEKVKNRYQRFELWQSEGKAMNSSILYDNKLVGHCGLLNMDFKHRHASFGTIIHHPYWRNGIALVSRYLYFTHAFEVLKLNRISSGTRENNYGVRSFYEKHGIELESIEKQKFFSDGKFCDNYCYAILAHQWPAVKKSFELELAQKQLS